MERVLLPGVGTHPRASSARAHPHGGCRTHYTVTTQDGHKILVSARYTGLTHAPEADDLTLLALQPDGTEGAPVPPRDRL